MQCKALWHVVNQPVDLPYMVNRLKKNQKFSLYPLNNQIWCWIGHSMHACVHVQKKVWMYSHSLAVHLHVHVQCWSHCLSWAAPFSMVTNVFCPYLTSLNLCDSMVFDFIDITNILVNFSIHSLFHQYEIHFIHIMKQQPLVLVHVHNETSMYYILCRHCKNFNQQKKIINEKLLQEVWVKFSENMFEQSDKLCWSTDTTCISWLTNRGGMWACTVHNICMHVYMYSCTWFGFGWAGWGWVLVVKQHLLASIDTVPHQSVAGNPQGQDHLLTTRLETLDNVLYIPVYLQ